MFKYHNVAGDFKQCAVNELDLMSTNIFKLIAVKVIDLLENLAGGTQKLNFFKT